MIDGGRIFLAYILVLILISVDSAKGGKGILLFQIKYCSKLCNIICRHFSCTHYGSWYFISEEYTKHPGHSCNCELDSAIGTYSTIEAAKVACLNDRRCGCITDVFCNGSGVWTVPTGYCSRTQELGIPVCAYTLPRLPWRYFSDRRHTKIWCTLF